MYAVKPGIPNSPKAVDFVIVVFSSCRGRFSTKWTLAPPSSYKKFETILYIPILKSGLYNKPLGKNLWGTALKPNDNPNCLTKNKSNECLPETKLGHVNWGVVYPKCSYKIGLPIYNRSLNCFFFVSGPGRWRNLGWYSLQVNEKVSLNQPISIKDCW